MIDVALVAYLNTRPFMDGFEAHISDQEACFHLYPPSACADALYEKKCQIALIPVGSLPRFQRLSIMPNYCLGANGPVESVFLFSQRPVEKLDTILLDPHSNTSNGLVQILMRYHWKRKVDFVMPGQKHFDMIDGNVGGVIIGDKALHVRNHYRYAYDLSGEWQKMTGLPFAFAVWAYYPGQVSAQFLQKMNDAMRWGVHHLDACAEKWAAAYKVSLQEATRYLNESLDFRFDAPKHRAVELYYKTLRNLSVPAPQMLNQ